MTADSKTVAHTPGPWRFDGAEIHAAGERVVEFYSIDGVPADRIAANGALIAKAPIAPKLAEALRAAREWMDDRRELGEYVRPITLADAALAEWDAQ